MLIEPQHEARIYSQNGEDGIIAYIFGKIGTTNTVAVEFGVGDGRENNTRLLGDLGWKLHWFDCDELIHRPRNCDFVQTLLTPDNIQEIFRDQRIPREFDLLSIDVDGNDFYLRAALADYRPRLCVMEYNGCFGPDVEYVMPRQDDYRWRLWDKNYGASLRSLTQQAQDLGYDLLYCDNRGVNAFYLRRDINPFEVPSLDQAWRPLWWANQT